MKIKDAILQGIQQVPKHARNVFFREPLHGEEFPTDCCVLGAAWVGSQGLERFGAVSCTQLENLFEVLQKNGVHPEVPGSEFDVYSIATDLNDVYGWSRERIADWLDLIESGSSPDEIRKWVATSETDAIGERSLQTPETCADV